MAKHHATAHAIEDILEGRAAAIPGRPFLLVYATGIELWSWPPRPALQFRKDPEDGQAVESSVRAH